MGSGGNSGGGLDLADTTVPEDTEIYHIKWIQMSHLHIYTLEYIEYISINAHLHIFMYTTTFTSTYGFGLLERMLP